MFARLRATLTPARLLVGTFVCLVTLTVFLSSPGLEARGEEWENLQDEAKERAEKAKDNRKEAVERVENVSNEVEEAVEIDAGEVGSAVVRSAGRSAARNNRRERWED